MLKKKKLKKIGLDESTFTALVVDKIVEEKKKVFVEYYNVPRKTNHLIQYSY